ncbi:hypothetical protein LDENG_00090700 [Lucifuga dentata]|nr:hypothetical protein LDENG_00090700 [Lucifuga dentata]
MEANEHLTYEEFIVVSGEDMEGVEDESVDVVVCTLVLCSVNNVQSVLQEARRVLRTGGAFYFMEHVVADPSSWTYFFQHVLQPLWYYLGDRCDDLGDDHKGNMERSRDSWFLRTSPQTVPGSTGHFNDKTTHHGIFC